MIPTTPFSQLRSRLHQPPVKVSQSQCVHKSVENDGSPRIFQDVYLVDSQLSSVRCPLRCALRQRFSFIFLLYFFTSSAASRLCSFSVFSTSLRELREQLRRRGKKNRVFSVFVLGACQSSRVLSIQSTSQKDRQTDSQPAYLPVYTTRHETKRDEMNLHSATTPELGIF